MPTTAFQSISNFHKPSHKLIFIQFHLTCANKTGISFLHRSQIRMLCDFFNFQNTFLICIISVIINNSRKSSFNNFIYYHWFWFISLYTMSTKFNVIPHLWDLVKRVSPIFSAKLIYSFTITNYFYCHIYLANLYSIYCYCTNRS